MINKPKNIQASIHARLKNIAKIQGENVETLLYRYVSERFLYRLSLSSYREQFFLKGAFLFTIWESQPHRATRDIDFLGTVPDQIDLLEHIVKDICSIECEEDGLMFNPDSIVGEAIREGQSYGGIRLSQIVNLGKSKVVLQIDMGFGDAMSPAPKEIEVPSILEMPRAKIMTYPINSVISEKFEAMVSLDIANSRMKDFYDIWFLIKNFEIDPEEVALAIQKTFSRRDTAIPSGVPTALTREFALDDQKVLQWRAFLRKNAIKIDEIDLFEVVQDLNGFFIPILERINEA